jgi:O-antigen/teichoic acid export membrane protein
MVAPKDIVEETAAQMVRARLRVLFSSRGTGLSIRRAKIVGDLRRASPVTLVATIVAMARSFILARTMGPGDYGWVATLNLVLTYTELTHLGISPGLQRQLLYYRGKNRLDLERPLIGTAMLSWLAVAGPVAALFVISPAVVIDVPAGGVTGAARLLGVIIALQAATLFLTVILTVNKQFIELSRVVLLRTAVELLLGVTLGLKFGVIGVFAGFLIAWTAALGWSLVITGFRPFLAFDEGLWIELLRIGFPISVSVFGWTLIRSLDRVFIVRDLTAHDMGLYSLGAMVASLLYMVPMTLAGVVVPHITEAFAKHEQDESMLAPFLEGPTIGIAYGGVILAGFTCVAAYWVTPVLLPAYTAGLPALSILAITAVVQSVVLTAASILGNILISRRRFWLQIAVQGASAGVTAILCEILLKQSPRIESVAYASLAGAGVYSTFVLMMTSAFVLKEPARIARFMGLVCAPIIGAIAFLWLL